MTTIQLPQPPRGFKAKLWRIPIWFYRMGLGGLLGKRFLLLTHIGRKSGQPRQAVIEVVKKDSQNDIYYSVSGFGEKAQWFQNILHTPQVDIQVGGQKMSVHAERLSINDGEKILSAYAEQHPIALRELSKMLKIPYDGNPESISKMAKAMPVVAFHVNKNLP